jgi:DNA-nicking Smr family endonuclease
MARSGQDDDRDLFEEAMRDVQPIDPGPTPLPAGKPARRSRRRGLGRTPPAPTRFELEEEGERIEGWIPGFDRRRLARLARGDLPPETTVDLHGSLEAEARRAVREALSGAWEADVRTVLIIHGRGLHSPEGPVLKRALPAWLAEPPVGPRVLAFASAPPALGGPGATLVLLRKRSRRRS